MGQGKQDKQAIESTLAKIEFFISDTIFPNIPFVLKGSDLVADKKQLKSCISRQVERSFAGLPSKKRRQLKKKLLQKFNGVAASVPFDPQELDNEVAEPQRTLIMAGPDKVAAIENFKEKGRIYADWLSVRHALVSAGAHLEIIEPALAKGGFREVFTRDRYILIGDTAYLPDPEKIKELLPANISERNDYLGELDQIKNVLQEHDVKTVTVEGASFEGGNVIQHSGSRTLFVGVVGSGWFREEFAQKLLDAVNATQDEVWTLIPVPLKDADMYHLDTGMSEPLPHGEVLLSPLLTDEETYRAICDRIGRENIVVLSDEDAKNLATNLMDVGDTLVMTACSNELREQLTGRGYKVVTPAAYGSDSCIGRGGVHCITNELPSSARKRHSSARPLT